ncbi:hypothetical protein Nmel_001023 [Mimus melanotis]
MVVYLKLGAPAVETSLQITRARSAPHWLGRGLQILTQKMLQFQLKTFLSVRRTAAMGSCGPTSCGLVRPWIPVCSRRWRRSWIFVTSVWSLGPRPWCIPQPCSPRRSRPEASQSRNSTWNPLLPPTGSGSTSRVPAGLRYRRRWRDTRRRSSPEPRDHLRSAGSGPAQRVKRGAGGPEAAARLRAIKERRRGHLRHRELLKEKRRRHQELFAEQKKRKLLPEAVLQELQELQDVSARPTVADDPPQAVADDPVTLGEELEAEAVELDQDQAKGQDQVEVQEKKGKRSKGARTKGNYMAVCLKDHNVTGLHQQLAKDFLNAQLYGPHTNRVQANEFFSLANKKDPVKKAAVQFVDKSWGHDKKEKAARFKKCWLATQIKNGV